MTRQIDSKVWMNRSQPTASNVVIILPAQNTHPSKPNKRRDPVAVQRVRDDHRAHQSLDDDYSFMERQKHAATGRWVLDVIGAREAYEQAQIESYYGHTQQAPHVNQWSLSEECHFSYISRERNQFFPRRNLVKSNRFMTSVLF